MYDKPDWNDSIPGMLGAATLAGVLSTCAWLLANL